MSAPDSPDKISSLIAEEILRTIFGDDFAGCPVPLDRVAVVVQSALEHNAAHYTKILDLYETVLQSIHQLTIPPDPQNVAGPPELLAILGRRLDGIHTIAAKTIDMVARVKAERSGNS